MWLQASEEERLKITASYFMYAPRDGWTDVGAEKLDLTKSAPRKPKQEGFLGALLDFDATLSSFISSGDPMYVVSATKAEAK